MIYFISPALGFSDPESLNPESFTGKDTEPEYTPMIQEIVNTLASESVLELQKNAWM